MNRPQNTESPQSELASRLHDYFPQLSSDDIAKFETHLHEQNIAEERNGYRLNFVGREYARLQAGLPSDMLISPDAEHNAIPENAQSGNVFVTGDNLEALRHLQNAYAGKVKMIYIDPPYNTGKEFVYKDHFELDDAKLKTALGYSDEDIARLRSIQDKSSHSAWLTFMYPRLALAKKLLSDDGVIFVSIDDNEQANLKLLMDDVFGEGNLVCNFIWQKKTGASDATNVATITEYIIVYSKNIECAEFSKNKESYDVNRYKFSDEFKETRGAYYIDNLDRGGLQYSDSMNYGIECPDGAITFPNGRREYKNDGWIWKWSKAKIEWARENKFIEFRKSDTKESGWAVCYKNYLYVDNENKPIERAAPHKNIIQGILNTHATAEISDLFDGRKLFDTPKPVDLVKFFMKLTAKDEDVILDFFAGSGTTAHAVMQLNAEDGGNRKWIMVQLDEPTAENSEARKAPFNFTTIDQISRERIRRAGDKIKSERPPDLFDDKTALDTGFRHYRLIEPEVRTLDKIETFDPNLGGFEDMIAPMGGRETILTTWLIDDGYPFDTQVDEVIFEGYTTHYVAASQTLYLIDSGMTTVALKAMLNRVGRGELVVSTIVAYPYSFEFERMRELEIGVKMVDDLKLNKRY